MGADLPHARQPAKEGFPEIMVKTGRLLALELKTETGRESRAR